ncbi:MAG: PD40 domain-containing protein [Balneola sp.]
MKKIALFLFIAVHPFFSFAQNSTEIYLFEFTYKNNTYQLNNPINVSDNEGYDNQPSFTEDGKSLLYASTRNEQTDILWYDIESGSKRWITNTPGGEYSPVLMPDGEHISAVRLDPDGLQLLYKYSIKDGSSEVLIPNLKIGYYSWFLTSRIIAFVLGEPATLQEIDLSHNEIVAVDENPGRSIHYIPATKRYSYIDKSDPDNWKIMKAVPNNSEWTEEITSTLSGVEDMVWLNMHTILMGKDDKLYYFDTHSESTNWKLFADLSEFGLSGITRLAKIRNKIAVVVNGK